MINNRGKTHRRATARRGSTMFIIFMIICSFAFTTNTPPVVSNVSFAQRTDGSGIVDVYYDVDDADGDSLKISIAVISNVSDTSNLFNIDSLVSGDVGRGIYSGTGKHIIWQYGTGNPNTYSNEVIIKITADDTQAATTIADYDGNSYATVQIGNQLWMAENLKTTHYNNGDEIQYVQDESSEPNVWENLSTGAYGYYEDNPSYKETYGNLYNWYAVDDERGVCPEGYHVPTDAEYTVLTDYLGGTSVAGGKMKEAGNEHWNYFNDQIASEATNESGFTGLPTGYRSSSNGEYGTVGSYGFFWSSSEDVSIYAWHRNLEYSYSAVTRSSYGKRSGFSVRCVFGDCAGVEDGTAIVDNCGNCVGGTTGATACTQDCGGTWGGSATTDNCGTCDSDSSNDCVQDCAGTWGGSASGSCIQDYDGNSYSTVQIGNQLWMSENLKTTHYNNGDEIPYPSNADWESYTEGQYGVYDNDPSNAEVYGNLYNWAAATDERGVCPEGYHVPTDDEYKVLEMYLGMSESEVNDIGNRGTNEGSKLAGNADLWNDGNLENNSEVGSSGFNCLPSGYRYDLGSDYYYNMGYYGYFWSSSEANSSDAWARRLYYDDSDVYRGSNTKPDGFSVRCLGD